MTRVFGLSVVLVVVLAAGCAGLVPGGPAEPGAETATETTRTTHDCDTFGTGGIAPLGETNTTVRSVVAAKASLQTVIPELSDYPYNVSALDHVPRDDVAETGEIRGELERYDLQPPDPTLYYFSPRDSTRLDEMVIVTEGGALFVIYIGAC